MFDRCPHRYGDMVPVTGPGQGFTVASGLVCIPLLAYQMGLP